MRRFAQLFAELDTTTATSAKVDALKRYFASAEPRDAAWAVYFLSGGTPRQVVRTALLRSLACERAGIADWLFEASYQAVGDFAETVAYILPPPEQRSDVGLADWMETRLLPLRGEDPLIQGERIGAWWNELETPSRFLLNKLMGGGFRVGVSKLLVQRALAEYAGIDAKLVARRMIGYTDGTTNPGVERYEQLIAKSDSGSADVGQPYPFFLAHALEIPPSSFEAVLGPAADWFVEWKYDGIRAQVLKRAGQIWIWSRGEELVTDRFPEVVSATSALPDGTVLDGEIVVWKDGAIASFSLLQRRIGRKSLSKNILAEAPVGFIAYDLLEWDGVDLRERTQAERRELLAKMVLPQSAIHLSPIERRSTWEEYATLREDSRTRGVEGFMLKHRLARYGVGRRKQDDVPGGAWWKWKIDPLSVDAVLVYAQAGHGRRAGVYTDYTFAVWNRVPHDAAEAQAVVDAIERREAPPEGALQLVAFAKAYSGLTDEEFREVDRVIRQTTIEKFGPVRSVEPSMVFEIGFEGINRSTRHKSGIAVRFPRMLRIRSDKPLHEADTLHSLEALLAFHHNIPGTGDVD